MKDTLPGTIETLDELRKELLDSVRLLPQDLRKIRPAPESWSPLEIAEHCVLVQQLLLGTPCQATNSPAAPPSWLNKMTLAGIRCALRWRLPLPASLFGGARPTGARSLSDLASAWGEIMAILRTRVNTNASTTCCIHPLAGPLTTRQAVDLAMLHAAYYLPILHRSMNTTLPSQRR